MFKTTKKIKYQKRILKSFPIGLTNDVKKVLEILPFSDVEVKLVNGENHIIENLIHTMEQDLKVANEIITIPYRLYFDEPNLELENNLTERQKNILNCIFLRHHNGYLREKRLKMLSEQTEKWTIPFIVQLLGEYIYELLPIIDEKVNDNTLDFYVEFRNENPKYWQLTESRMISYWNEYYRYQFPKLKEYLGFEILNRIKKEGNNGFLSGSP
jgi:hypothetical protein